MMIVPAMLGGGCTILVVSCDASAFAGIFFLLAVQVSQRKIGKSIAARRRVVSKKADEHLQLQRQVIRGARVIKAYGWVEPLQQRVNELRKAECAALWSLKRLKAFNYALSFIVPALTTLIIFTVFVLIYGQEALRPSVVFVAMATINPSIRPSMTHIPRLVSILSDGSVSLRRIRDFLTQPSVPNVLNTVQTQAADNMPATPNLTACKFQWGVGDKSADASPEDHFVLSVDSLALPRGSLTCLLGQVGAGKTALLHGLLGEMSVSSGAVASLQQGAYAYCAQEPWVPAGTVRSIVVWGEPSHRQDLKQYEQALTLAQLGEDLVSFPAADETEVGEHGITLSGGQKARLALARAAYRALSDPSCTVMLDDVLAAVDGVVGQRISKDMLLGALQERTRVIVLSSPNELLLQEADQIVVMRSGVAHAGTLAEMRDHLTAIRVELTETWQQTTEVHTKDAELRNTQIPSSVNRSSAAGKLHITEERVQGNIRLATFRRFFAWASTSGHGAPLLFFVVLTFLLAEGGRVSVDVWLT